MNSREQRARIRPVPHAEPDLRRLARALIELAMKEKLPRSKRQGKRKAA